MKKSLVFSLACVAALAAGSVSAADVAENYSLARGASGLGLKMPAVAAQPRLQSVGRFGVGVGSTPTSPFQKAFLIYRGGPSAGGFVYRRHYLETRVVGETVVARRQTD